MRSVNVLLSSIPLAVIYLVLEIVLFLSINHNEPTVNKNFKCVHLNGFGTNLEKFENVLHVTLRPLDIRDLHIIPHFLLLCVQLVFTHPEHNTHTRVCLPEDSVVHSSWFRFGFLRPLSRPKPSSRLVY